MEHRASRLVVVGASAGGVEARKTFVAGVPGNLPAAVGIVLHLSPDSRSRLPEILSRAGRLPTAHTADSVYEDQTAAVEYPLWAAFRPLHQRAELSHRIAHRTRGSGSTSKRFEDLSREALEQANLIQTVLLERNDGED
jgi:CheB methylesterase